MNRRSSRTCCLILGATVLATVAQAQEAQPSAQDGYEDRLIDGGNLQPDLSFEEVAGPDAGGWPRAFQVQAMTSEVSRDGSDIREHGLRFSGMLDTPQHGALTLDAHIRASSGDGDGSGNLVTLVQRSLPMNGDWFINNTLGVANTPSTDLARQQQRFSVPTLPMSGAVVEWTRPGQLQIQGSVGEPGEFTGVYVPTFDGLGGRQAGGGLQWGIADGWSTALQMIDVGRARSSLHGEKVTGQSWFGALAWDSRDARSQVNLVSNSTADDSGHLGAWLDGAIRTGRTWHTMGVFRLDPGLRWGTAPLASDMEGGHYRAAFQSRRWTLDGGVDQLSSVSGRRRDTTFGTGYARYQYSSTLSFGGGTSALAGSTSAWSTFGFVDSGNRYGIGRAQLSHARNDGQDNTQLNLDQTWTTAVGRRASTALLLGHENLESHTANTVGLAAFGGGDFPGNVSLDVNARWNTTFGDESTDNWLANVAISWAFARGWTAGANLYMNRVSGRVPLTVESPIQGEDPYERLQSDDQGVFAYIRYEWRAGSAAAPLGGKAGSGAGSVVGMIFLDANDNGRFDAGEAGAANVVVLLDGRFPARTDADGRFVFPAVVAGQHFLTLMPDNLPLPWTVPQEVRNEFQVSVRGQTHVEIPARRFR